MGEKVEIIANFGVSSEEEVRNILRTGDPNDSRYHRETLLDLSKREKNPIQFWWTERKVPNFGVYDGKHSYLEINPEVYAVFHRNKPRAEERIRRFTFLKNIGIAHELEV